MRSVKVLESFVAFAGLTCGAWGQKLAVAKVKGTQSTSPPALHDTLAIPDRPEEPLFQGESPAPKPEIHFDASTGMVTVRMAVEDSSGRFIPNIRRENFAVYENGVRQASPDIEIEHAPVTLAVLMQWGGRYQGLNQEMYDEVPRAAQQLLAEIGKRDKVAIWKYGDRTEQVADFSKSHDAFDAVFLNLSPPEFSEANLYDALISTLERMRTVSGRKAVALISTGIDTFSKAGYADVLNSARESGTPVYAINVGPALRSTMDQVAQGGPYARLDWNVARQHLQEIARASGGRLYAPNSTFDLSGVYDDMMENLRVRYLISYKQPASNSNAPRTVRVDLIDPRTGGPLEIRDARGQSAPAKWSVQETYVPHAGPVAHAASASPAAQE